MKRSFEQAHKRQSGDIRYKHDLGQHFLYDEALLRSLVAKTGIGKDDSVLEIGAGAGTLTKILSRAAARVTAIEVDEQLMPMLNLAISGLDNVTIAKGDVRRLDLGAITGELGEGFSVVGNIPYNITTPILGLFLGGALKPKQLSLMVQKEVADKLLCPPGGEDYCLMSFLCQYYCEGEIVDIIPASLFAPPPKVDSAFINLFFRGEPIAPVKDEGLLIRMVKASFQQRRKTLTNALGGAVNISGEALRGMLRGLELSETVRGEALTIKQWIELSNLCSEAMS